jgi:hypothetical protein
MGLLSSIFGGGSVKSPNIQGGLNEATRQMLGTDALSYDQYLDTTGRLRRQGDELSGDIGRERGENEAFIARTRAKMGGLNDQLTRGESESAGYRTTAEQEAARRGSEARRRQVGFNTGRRNDEQIIADEDAFQARAEADYRDRIMSQALSDIDATFGGYDDSFFEDYAKSIIDSRKPLLDRQYEDARRGATLGLSDRGNLRSSAAAKTFGRLIEGKRANEAALAGEASEAAAGLRASIDAQRAALRSQALFSSMMAPLPPVEGKSSFTDLRAVTQPPQQATPAQTRAPRLAPAVAIATPAPSAPNVMDSERFATGASPFNLARATMAPAAVQRRVHTTNDGYNPASEKKGLVPQGRPAVMVL